MQAYSDSGYDLIRGGQQKQRGIVRDRACDDSEDILCHVSDFGFPISERKTNGRDVHGPCTKGSRYPPHHINLNIIYTM